jgi:hypothetical protein
MISKAFLPPSFADSGSVKESGASILNATSEFASQLTFGPSSWLLERLL